MTDPDPTGDGSRTPAGPDLGIAFVSLAIVSTIIGTVFAAQSGNHWAGSVVVGVNIAALAAVVAMSKLPLQLRQPEAPRRDQLDQLDQPDQLDRSRRWTVILLAGALGCAALTADWASRIGVDRSAGAVAVPWLASVALVVTAASLHDLDRRRVSSRARDHRGTAAASPDRRRTDEASSRPTWRSAGPWCAVTLMAAVPRFIALDRYPTVVVGDEAAFMLAAVRARTGHMTDPFETGFYSNPNLFSAVQGWSTWVVGDGVAGHRWFSAMLGTIGVLATWRLGRRIVGPTAAWAGAAVLAFLPLHLASSRMAINFITDPTTLVVALLLMARALERGGRTDAAVCGVVLGLGFYGNYGGRSLPIVVLVVLAALVIARHVAWRAALGLAGWITVGFVVTAMPLIMAYVERPGEFGGHLEVVSTVSGATLRRDPSGTLARYLGNIDDAALYPISGNGRDLFFRHEPPYLGWFVAIGLTVGAGVWLAGLRRERQLRQSLWLAVPWGLLTLGVASAVPVHGHRLLVLAPLVSLLVGAAIVTTAGWIGWAVAGRRDDRAGAVVTTATIVASLLLATVVQVRWWFDEDRQQTTYGDVRTTAMWDLGSRLPADGTAVLFAGAPFVYSDGFPNLTFVSPSARLGDVDEPIGARPPTIGPVDALVLVPERIDEACGLERAHPNLHAAASRDRAGRLLYLVYYQGGDGPAGWSRSPTSAGTTLVEMTGPTCGLAVTPVPP